MISGIDQKFDIEIFLENAEADRLSSEHLEGSLIKIQNPAMQGKLDLSVNDSRKYENGFGIGVYDKEYWGIPEGFCLYVFMGKEWYETLMSTGRIGMRQRMRDGSKIDIYKIGVLDSMSRSRARTLEFYKDNREKLKKRLNAL